MFKQYLLAAFVCFSVHVINSKPSALNFFKSLIKYEQDFQKYVSSNLFEKNIQKFIDQGGNINEMMDVSFFSTGNENEHSVTNLLIACISNHRYHYSQTLLEHGADPILMEMSGRTALDFVLWDICNLCINTDLQEEQRSILLHHCLSMMYVLISYVDVQARKIFIEETFLRLDHDLWKNFQELYGIIRNQDIASLGLTDQDLEKFNQGYTLSLDTVFLDDVSLTAYWMNIYKSAPKIVVGLLFEYLDTFYYKDDQQLFVQKCELLFQAVIQQGSEQDLELIDKVKNIIEVEYKLEWPIIESQDYSQGENAEEVDLVECTDKNIEDTELEISEGKEEYFEK